MQCGESFPIVLPGINEWIKPERQFHFEYGRHCVVPEDYELPDETGFEEQPCAEDSQVQRPRCDARSQTM